MRTKEGITNWFVPFRISKGLSLKFEIIIQAKKEVLDPEARAIQNSLNKYGFTHLDKVEVSKRFVLSFSETEKNPREKAELIAKEHLANPVAETYHITRQAHEQ